MSLTTTAESAAASAVSSAGHVVGVCFTVFFVGLCGGFMGGWTVHGWQTASTTAAGATKAANSAAKETIRRGAIAQNYVQRKQVNEDFYAANPDWWILWTNAHPGIAACDIGADGLLEWNRWNQGPGPYDPEKPVAAVPGNAAGGGERSAQGSVGKPQAGGQAVLQLQGQGRGPDSGGEKR